MDHNPSGGAGGSGRRPPAASPDQRPDQDLLPPPADAQPLGGSTGATVSPENTGHVTTLQLDAVSDYVPDTDDGLALDYGPVPDDEAARDYGKALDYDALLGRAAAPGHPAAPPGHSPAPPGHPEAPPGHSAAAPGHSAAPPGHSAAPLFDVAAPLTPAAHRAVPPRPGPGPVGEAATPKVPAPASPSVPAPAPAPASVPALAPASPSVPAPAPAPASVPALAPAPALVSVGAQAATSAASPALEPVPLTDSATAPDPAHAPDTAATAADLAAHHPAGDDGPAARETWEAGPAGQVSPATYWRRRAVALVVAIAVLTVLAWAVSGVLHGGAASQGTGHGGRPSARSGTARRAADPPGQLAGRRTGRSGHATRRNSPQSLPGPTVGRANATGQARTVGRVHDTGAGAGPSGPGTPSGAFDVLTMWRSRQRDGATAPRTTPHAAVARAPGRRATAHAPGPRVAACGRGEVVLSLVSPRYWYQRGRWPLFGVDAVSTGNRPCRFDMGSRFATVVVTSGRHRIWGSADCIRGVGSQPVVLSRGVPAVRWIYWDRATSIPGCPRPGRAVGQGAYKAIAFDGRLTSQVLVFRLDPGTALP